MEERCSSLQPQINRKLGSTDLVINVCGNPSEIPQHIIEPLAVRYGKQRFEDWTRAGLIKVFD
jgi:hypothetical protein